MYIFACSRDICHDAIGSEHLCGHNINIVEPRQHIFHIRP